MAFVGWSFLGFYIGFTKSLAAEVADRGVRVNSVALGPTDTLLLAPDSPWRAPPSSGRFL